MLNYLTLLKLKKKNILLNYLTSSDYKRLWYSSLESPHRDESKGGKTACLASIDGK